MPTANPTNNGIPISNMATHLPVDVMSSVTSKRRVDGSIVSAITEIRNSKRCDDCHCNGYGLQLAWSQNDAPEANHADPHPHCFSLPSRCWPFVGLYVGHLDMS